MDLTRDIIYRGFTLNDASIRANVTAPSGIGTGISGCVVDSVDDSDIDVVQFLEKRSEQDGMDAGDVFLGARRIRMAGTMYATTRALLYDLRRAWKAALSPTLAQRDSPADHGYQPLYFAEPTNDTANWPTGIIDLQINAMPRASQTLIDRDQVGGNDANALAIPWQATFIVRDPRILGSAVVDHDFAASFTADSGNLNNRGNYYAPLHALFVVSSAAGTISLTLGGSVFTITVPASTGDRIIRYKGDDKVLTVEENSVELLRMDLLTFLQSTTHPLIPAGVSAYAVTVTGTTVKTGSHMWFWESFA